jgi:hypothetical protein
MIPHVAHVVCLYVSRDCHIFRQMKISDWFINRIALCILYSRNRTAVIISEFKTLILLLHVPFIFYIHHFNCGISLGFLIALSIQALYIFLYLLLLGKFHIDVYREYSVRLIVLPILSSCQVHCSLLFTGLFRCFFTALLTFVSRFVVLF